MNRRSWVQRFKVHRKFSQVFSVVSPEPVNAYNTVLFLSDFLGRGQTQYRAPSNSTQDCKTKHRHFVTVHGFKGSGVQGSILIHGVHLDYVFMRKASASSGPIQNLELNWQLLGKMSIFNDDFGSLIPSLPSYVTPQRWSLFFDQTGRFVGQRRRLTLNVEL